MLLLLLAALLVQLINHDGDYRSRLPLRCKPIYAGQL